MSANERWDTILRSDKLKGENVWRKVLKHRVYDGECWVWSGSISQGYGRFNVFGFNTRPHRIAWAIFKGELRRGIVISQTCGKRSCFNPAHLFENEYKNLKRGSSSPEPSEIDWGRFWGSVAKTDECWDWIGYVKRDGYSVFCFRGKLLSAHRFAYRYLNGEIPDGLHIDHLCRNRRCVNPAHLEAVTQAENNRRAREQKET